MARITAAADTSGTAPHRVQAERPQAAAAAAEVGSELASWRVGNSCSAGGSARRRGPACPGEDWRRQPAASACPGHSREDLGPVRGGDMPPPGMASSHMLLPHPHGRVKREAPPTASHGHAHADDAGRGEASPPVARGRKQKARRLVGCVGRVAHQRPLDTSPARGPDPSARARLLQVGPAQLPAPFSHPARSKVVFR